LTTIWSTKPKPRDAGGVGSNRSHSAKPTAKSSAKIPRDDGPPRPHIGETFRRCQQGKSAALAYAELSPRFCRIFSAREASRRCVGISTLDGKPAGQCARGAWSEIDVEAAVWTIGADMKARKKHKSSVERCGVAALARMEKSGPGNSCSITATATKPRVTRQPAPGRRRNAANVRAGRAKLDGPQPVRQSCPTVFELVPDMGWDKTNFPRK